MEKTLPTWLTFDLPFLSFKSWKQIQYDHMFYYTHINHVYIYTIWFQTEVFHKKNHRQIEMEAQQKHREFLRAEDVQATKTTWFAIRVFSIMNLGDSLGCVFFLEGNFWEKGCLSTSFFYWQKHAESDLGFGKDLFQKKTPSTMVDWWIASLTCWVKTLGKKTHFLSACSCWVGIPIPKRVEPAVSNGWLGLFSSNSNHLLAHKDSNKEKLNKQLAK